MSESRQTKAYNQLLETFFKLVDASKNVPNKEDLKAELHEIFDYPVVRENLTQAFSNCMWSMDRAIEFQVASELGTIAIMIGSSPPGQTEPGKAIVEMMLDVIESNDTPLTDIEEDEIEQLTKDEEEDNTPIPLI